MKIILQQKLHFKSIKHFYILIIYHNITVFTTALVSRDTFKNDPKHLNGIQ